MAGGPHLIPFRTQSLSPLAPMVLRLKAWESRSLPGPQSPDTASPCRHLSFTTTAAACRHLIRPQPYGGPDLHFRATALECSTTDAGWSSPVARQAHNLKVAGSNPAPATKFLRVIIRLCAVLRGDAYVSNHPWKHCGSKRGRSPSCCFEKKSGSCRSTAIW